MMLIDSNKFFFLLLSVGIINAIDDEIGTIMHGSQEIKINSTTDLLFHQYHEEGNETIKQGPIHAIMVKNSIKDICEKLQSKSDNPGLSLEILAVGLTDVSLMLITRDYFVYEVAKNEFFVKQLSHIEPKELSERFPKLYNDFRFQRIKHNPYNGFFLQFGQSYTLCITTTMKMNYPGVNYNLNTEQVTNGFIFTNAWNEIMISTTEKGFFYSLRQWKETVLQIAAYQLKDFQLYRIADYQNICQVFRNNSDEFSETIVLYSQNSTDACTNVKWPVLNGFVANKTFYLFAHQFIYTFKDDLFQLPGTEVNVTKLSYNEFLDCSPSLKYLGSASNSTTATTVLPSNPIHYLIYSACLIVIVAIIVFLFKYFKSAPTPN